MSTAKNRARLDLKAARDRATRAAEAPEVRAARLERRRQQARARHSLAAETPEMRQARLERRRQQARARHALEVAGARNARLEKRRQQASQRALVAYVGEAGDTPAERQTKRDVAVVSWELLVLQTQQQLEQDIKEREVLEAVGTVDEDAREHEALFLKW